MHDGDEDARSQDKALSTITCTLFVVVVLDGGGGGGGGGLIKMTS